MRIKSKPQDFRVYELLQDGYVGDKGRFRVYRVTKKKLTTLEAASELALATGVHTSEIGMAGMKDRQGVTTQFMTVRGGRPVRFQTPSLKVETVGFAMHGLSSRDSIGNGFEIALRGVEPEERAEIEREAVAVREHGVPNYFGEQRFGNLRHGQGWVAKELALGRAESALRNLLAAPSENDNPHMRSFKRGLNSAWGDWKRCRDVAGAFGAHHSIFEHLAKEPDDFAGAFRYVKTEVRLIHLYAFQSHIWNRAVARFLGETAPPKDRLVVPSLEGPLVFTRGALAVPETWNGNFRMPGECLEDVEHEDQRRWLTAALAAEGMAPEDYRIHGVDGFGLKGEDRPLVVHPRALEIHPDRRAEGVLHVSFDLPRGSYATLVLARLAPTRAAETPDDAARRQARRETGNDQGERHEPYGEGRREEDAGGRGWRHDRPRHEDTRRSHGAFDAPRHEARREDRPRHAAGRYDAPGFDAPRHDRPRNDAQGEDRPRYDAPRPAAPHEDRPRPAGRGPGARRGGPRGFEAPRRGERRHDDPPVEYRREGVERYDHTRPDGPRRGRSFQPNRPFPGPRHPPEGEAAPGPDERSPDTGHRNEERPETRSPGYDRPERRPPGPRGAGRRDDDRRNPR